MLIDSTFELGIPTHISFTLFKYDYFDSVVISRVKKECKNYSEVDGEYSVKVESFIRALTSSKRLRSEIKRVEKNKVILESQLMARMGTAEDAPADPVNIDKLVYNSFVKKFNEKYDNNLLEEQRNLLSCYINSFSDNALELKVFLNEEIARLRLHLEKSLQEEIIADDADMIAKTHKLIEKLDSYRDCFVNEEVLTTVLKTQQIVKDIFEDGRRN